MDNPILKEWHEQRKAEQAKPVAIKKEAILKMLVNTVIWCIPGILMLIPIILFTMVMMAADAIGATDWFDNYKKLPDGLRASLGPLLIIITMVAGVFLIIYEWESIYIWGALILSFIGGIYISVKELRHISSKIEI